MGYETNFKITSEYEGDDLDIEDLHEISGYYFVPAFNSDYESEEKYKWYNHDEDMIKLSNMGKYEDFLFCLEGEGEDQGDHWRKYYKNGLSASYCPKIVWPEFNEDDLE